MIEELAINFLQDLSRPEKGSKNQRGAGGRETNKQTTADAESFGGKTDDCLKKKGGGERENCAHLIFTSLESQSWWRSKAISMEAISWRERENSCLTYTSNFPHLSVLRWATFNVCMHNVALGIEGNEWQPLFFKLDTL